MGLRDLPIPSEVVNVSDGGSFTVRGFSPNDALKLYYRHRGQLSALFDQYTNRAQGGDPVEPAEVMQVGAALVGGAPQIMAEIIVIAAGGNPDDEVNWLVDTGIAINLSAGVQLDALEKIGRLTFTSDMPPPKFVGLVLSMAQSATTAMQASRA